MNVDQNLRVAKKNSELNKHLNSSQIIPTHARDSMYHSDKSPTDLSKIGVSGIKKLRKSSDITGQIPAGSLEEMGSGIVSKKNSNTILRLSNHSGNDDESPIMHITDSFNNGQVFQLEHQQTEASDVNKVGGSQKRRVFPRISEHFKESTSSNNGSAPDEEESLAFSYVQQQNRGSVQLSQALSRSDQNSRKNKRHLQKKVNSGGGGSSIGVTPMANTGVNWGGEGSTRKNKKKPKFGVNEEEKLGKKKLGMKKQPTLFIKKDPNMSDEEQELSIDDFSPKKGYVEDDEDQKESQPTKSKFATLSKQGTKFMRRKSESDEEDDDEEFVESESSIDRAKTRKVQVKSSSDEILKKKAGFKKQPTKFIRRKDSFSDESESKSPERKSISSNESPPVKISSSGQQQSFQSPPSKQYQQQDLPPGKTLSGTSLGLSSKVQPSSEGRRPSHVSRHATSPQSVKDFASSKIVGQQILNNSIKKESLTSTVHIAQPTASARDTVPIVIHEFQTVPLNDDIQNETPPTLKNEVTKASAMLSIPGMSSQKLTPTSLKPEVPNMVRRGSVNPSSAAQIKAQQQAIQLKRRATVQRIDNMVKAVVAYQDNKKLEGEKDPNTESTIQSIFQIGDKRKNSAQPVIDNDITPTRAKSIQPLPSLCIDSVTACKDELPLEQIESMLNNKIIEKLSQNQLPLQEQTERQLVAKLTRRQVLENAWELKRVKKLEEQKSGVGEAKRNSLFDKVKSKLFHDSKTFNEKEMTSDDRSLSPDPRRKSVQVKRIRTFGGHSIKNQIISGGKRKSTVKKQKSQEKCITPDKTPPLTPTPVITIEEKKRLLAERGKQLWSKARSAIKAVNSWKRVREEVLLYGTHNYELRKQYNVLTQHQINYLMHNSMTKVGTSREKFDNTVSKVTKRRPSLMHQNVLQLGLNPQQEENIKKQSCFNVKGRGGLYIHPDAQFKQVWSIIIIIFLLYVAFLMPFSLAFLDDSSNNLEPLITDTIIYDDKGKAVRIERVTTNLNTIDRNGAYYIDIIADFVFLLDVLVICFSAYYDENEGTLITNNKRIFKKYLSGWFVVDLVTSMPISLLEDSLNLTTHTEYIKILRFMRIPRLRRLLEVSKLGQFFRTITKDTFLLKVQDFVQENAGMMRLMTMVFTLISCIHVAACFWFLTYKLSDFAPDSWVVRMEYQDSSTAQKYLVSIYWAIATILTVGYGDLSGQTTLERGVSIIWMLIGVAFYALTIGMITSVLDRIDTKESHLNSKLETIDNFCNEAKVTLDLKKKIREALEYHSNNNAFSVINQRHNAVFQELPIQLRYEVAMQIHDGAIGKLPFFQNRDSTFVANIVPLLQPLKSQANEYLYQKGDHPYEIYFICRGRVNFHMDIGECVFKSWPKGAYFGEIEIIFDKRRICSAKAAPDTDCDLFILNKKFYQTLIHNDYPDINRELRKTALEREYKIFKALKKATEVLQAIGIEDPALESPKVIEKSLEAPSKSYAFKRMQSIANKGKDEHPGTKAALQKISRGFNEVAAGSRSYNASSYSRRSYSGSDDMFSEEDSSQLRESDIDPARKNQQKINKINDTLNLKFRRSMTENNAKANKQEADRLSKLKKNLLSFPTEEGLLDEIKEEAHLTHKITPKEKIMPDAQQKRFQIPQMGKRSIVVVPKDLKLESKESESFKSENFESDITSSSEDDDDASSNSGHNIWKNDKKSIANSSQSSSSSEDSKKREEKKEGMKLNFERLKTLKMLQGKKTAKFGSQSTNMQQMSIQSINLMDDKRKTQNAFSPNPLLQVAKPQSPINGGHVSLFAPANKNLHNNLNISVTNILRPSGTSTNSLYVPPRVLNVETKVLQLTISSESQVSSFNARLEAIKATLSQSSVLDSKVTQLEQAMGTLVGVLGQLTQKITIIESEQLVQQAEYQKLLELYEKTKQQDQDQKMRTIEIPEEEPQQMGTFDRDTPSTTKQLKGSITEDNAAVMFANPPQDRKSILKGNLRGLLRSQMKQNANQPPITKQFESLSPGRRRLNIKSENGSRLDVDAIDPMKKAFKEDNGLQLGRVSSSGKDTRKKVMIQSNDKWKADLPPEL